MDDAVKQKWVEQPEASYDVVIVLHPDGEASLPPALEADGVEPIPYQPGMFRAKLTGAELLSLAERSEVEDISPDETAQAL